MYRRIIIIENVRSVYNVGNIIRTADALGYDVILSGYTPCDDRVQKTALGAQHTVNILKFWNTLDALQYCRQEQCFLVAGELTKQSLPLGYITSDQYGIGDQSFALIVGNEVTGVLQETLQYVDLTVHIPMSGNKESLNV